MTTLMLSSDQNMLRADSPVARRIGALYGSMGDIHVVVRVPGRTHDYQTSVRSAEMETTMYVYGSGGRGRIFAFFRVFARARGIADLLKQRGERVIVTTQDPFELGFIGYCISRAMKIPLIAQVHTDFLSPFFYKSSLSHAARKMLGVWVLKRAFRVRVVSERVKQSLIKEGICSPSVIAALPVFIDHEARASVFSARAESDGTIQILIAGRLSREKNIAMALRAFARALATIESRTHIGLTIIGDGKERESLRRLTKKLSLVGTVRILPWTDDLDEQYARADICMMTSDYEGYGRTPVEALLAGVPVIMTDVGCAGEVVKNGKNGIIVPVRDERALTDAIVRVALSHQLLSGLKKEARHFKNEYWSSPSYAEQFRKLFEI